MTEIRAEAAVTIGMPSWARFWGDESGADMIEYVLIATLIALAAIAAMNGVGNKIASYYNMIGSSM